MASTHDSHLSHQIYTHVFWFCYKIFLKALGKKAICTLPWRHNGRDSISNHQPYDCLLNRLFRRRWKETSKLRVTGLCAGNSPVTGEFPAQIASNAENVSIWWRHHVTSNDKAQQTIHRVRNCLDLLNIYGIQKASYQLSHKHHFPIIPIVKFFSIVGVV